MPVTRRSLTSGWTVSLSSGPASAPELPDGIPATVPGVVHTDLLAAGLIPDPYLDENEQALTWIGHGKWLYRTTFDWDHDGSAVQELLFEGLDTVAAVALNGTGIANCANQHRSYRIPVGEHLRTGSNELEVVFDPVWEYAEALRDSQGDLPNAYPSPFNFVRKMACNFGWDWGPQLVTAGIWKPVSLQTWSVARLDRVRPVVGVDGTDGTLEILIDIASDASAQVAADLTVTAAIGEVTASSVLAAGSTSGSIQLRVPDVALWWPHDLGAQPLYDLMVTLTDSTGAELDFRRQRIGFRTITLDTSADEIGSAFTFVVNGEPIFVRGANWIPDDCFPSRITRDRLAGRIDQAIAANLHLLRVWGGGMFESDDFYALCDEKGVLVWQDFLFACAAYPEEEPIRREVLAEARENVARLMPHPSLAMWNGCNENIWGHEDWTWKDRSWKDSIGDRTWGAGYYFTELPAIVAEVDPGRAYYPGSPYSGSRGIHPNDDHHGLKHIWDVWNDVDYTHYRDYVPRFVAEFGYQGPPAASTMHRSISERPLTPTSPGMLAHQKAEDGNGKLIRGAAPHLPFPANGDLDIDDWHYLMQVNQAEAIRFGIEHFRSNRGTCMGTVLWQLNDCWPVTSWAAVDGDGRRKLLWYALRDSCAPHLLTFQPGDGSPRVVGVNDAPTSWHGEVRVQRIRFDGTVLAQHTGRLVMDRLSSASIGLPADVVTAANPAAELLVATTESGARALHFFVPDVQLELDRAELDIDVSQTGDTVEVTVSSPTLARHVALFADRLHPDGVALDALVTILPGESHVFELTVARSIGVDELVSSKALRHLADLAGG